MSLLKLFAALRAFILMCHTWGSLPHSGHLFHVLHLGLFATLTIFISCTTPKALCCSRGIYFICRAWGSSLHSGHIFHVSYLTLFATLRTFILVPSMHGSKRSCEINSSSCRASPRV